MKVPFFRPSLSEEDVEAVVSVLRSGWLTTGPKTKEFEERFAEYVGASHAIAVNSCTAALHLALEAVGVGPGDAVLVPTMTFAATAEVVVHLGAHPVFVDCDRNTLCMDTEHAGALASAIAEGKPPVGASSPLQLKAVMPMHYGGGMVDVGAVQDLARRHSLHVVEDAAHALPSKWRRTPDDEAWATAGTTADVSCFSFYANKCITTGEGGMATTDDSALADRMRMMSLHGMSKDAWRRFSDKGSWYYEVAEPGFKYNATDIASALGLAQLARADEFRQARARVAALYADGLAGLDAYELPKTNPQVFNSWHLFPLRINPSKLSIGRAELIRRLSERGITTSVHWMPLHLQPCYRSRFGEQRGQFPVAEREWERLISLPIYPSMSASEVEYVVDSLRKLAIQLAA